MVSKGRKANSFVVTVYAKPGIAAKPKSGSRTIFWVRPATSDDYFEDWHGRQFRPAASTASVSMSSQFEEIMENAAEVLKTVMKMKNS